MGHPFGRHRQREGATSYSSSATSKSPGSGRSRRPTSSSPSTSAVRSAAPERERSVKQLIGRVVDTITSWAQRAEVLRERRRSAGVQRRSEAPARLSEGGVQQPRVVQLRVREGAAVLGLLHQLRAGHDGIDPRAWRRPRACCSSSAPAPDRTCRRFGRRARLLAGGGTASGPCRS